MSLAIGLGIVEQAGKHYVILETTQDNMQVRLSIADEESYEQDIDIIIEGLTEIKKQMARAKSGLFVAEGVSLNGSSGSIQGRATHRPRSTGKQGSRTSKG